MFWSNSKSRSTQPPSAVVQAAWDTKVDLSPSVAFIENSSSPSQYKPAPITTESSALPFIKPETVADASRNGHLWVIIDDIIYDCTEFVHNHPGGARVIESFRGSNCSWQFWRFHSEKHLTEFGRPLRIGRTKGIKNKFKEPPRFVGLRKFWNSDY
ncbi:fatty acid desaturase [Fusarium acutatum]|uniref:Fatty acid desaturase n=1 Tax=Fusarium acutatum TaxID=78861 RepID=A0A8H4JGD2_9HYPO|nr:fatty acid desaturase [Fusarium acutatum]